METSVVESETIESSKTIIDTPRTFPLETLPLALKGIVLEAAKSLPVAPEMMVLPVLAVVGAAIGNSRSIQLKSDYQESAAIYGAVVAETGSMKSPSLAIAVKPLQIIDSKEHRTWTSDVTVEALGPLLAANPQGLLIVKDELAGLITSLNQYKGGKGSDRQFYLSAYSGSAMRVDRKGGAGMPPLHLSVAKPFLSVIGCIQPDVLPSLKAEHDAEDGFVERLLFVWPTPIPVRWTDVAISPASNAAYQSLIEQLVHNSWPSRPDPMPLPLTPGGQKYWQHWHDDHMEEAEKTAPQLRGFYSKLKGYCARLALIHAMASNPDATAISEESLRAAAEQIEFFKGEMRRVCEVLCRSVGRYSHEVERARKAILRGVQKHGELTRREAQRLQNVKASVFGVAWDSLTLPSLLSMPDGKYMVHPFTDTDIPTTRIRRERGMD